MRWIGLGKKMPGDESKLMHARASSASGLTVSQRARKISDKEAWLKKNLQGSKYKHERENLKLVLDLYNSSRLHPKFITKLFPNLSIASFYLFLLTIQV